MRTKEQIKLYKHNWYLKNIELCKKRSRLSEMKKDKVKEKIRKSIWKKNNRDKANLQMKRVYQRRYRNDIQYRLAIVLRNRIKSAIKKNIKSGSAVKDLGCSIDEFKKYLEKQFQSGMNWTNWSYRGWHIDHKIPLSSFNLSDSEEFSRSVHYTNLQPLWGTENLTKGGKI